MKESQVDIYFTDSAAITVYVTDIIFSETGPMFTFKRSDGTAVVVNTAFLRYYDVVRRVG